VGDQLRNPLPPLVAERLRALRERPIDPIEKGIGSLAAAQAGATGAGATGAGATGAGATGAGATGAGAAGGDVTAAGLAAARPGLHAAGFTYPLLTLRESALASNIEAMAAYCDRAGVALAPHGKTAMSPELAARQLAHGAWGITVATVGQLRTYRAFGFPRLLLANELVDEAGIAWLAAELAADPGFEAYCYVDSAEGVAILDRVLSHLPARRPAVRRLGVLVEIGHADGRTGCRTDAHALDVAKAAAATGTLRVAGVAGYEGSINAVSPVRRDPAGAPALRPAIELWAQVLSRPEPGLALLGAGRRDVGFDGGLPVPLRVERRGGPAGVSAVGVSAVGVSAVEVRGEVTELNDQHAYLRLHEGAALGPGDLVCLGISHPCTTLDKWRVIPVVSDDGRVIDAVRAFF
jgi:D-serine deaminase-like pyridoxal phosphate-dependent protein